LTCKTVSHITYTVLVETLNTAQSLNYAGASDVTIINCCCRTPGCCQYIPTILAYHSAK